MLFLEPLQPRGVRLILQEGSKVLTTREINHTDDLVQSVARLCKKKSPTKILVYSGVGSFSASRSSMVVATMWGSLCKIPVQFLLHGNKKKSVKTFQYVAPPHTTSKKS